MELSSPATAYSILKILMATDVEEFWALALGPRKELKQARRLFRGTVDSCLVHPRDVFRFACQTNASGLLIAHNHPGGDPLPSHADVQITKQLVAAGRIFQIPIVDHLLVTKTNYVSFAERGWCRF